MHLAMFPRREDRPVVHADHLPGRSDWAAVSIALSVDAGRPHSELGATAQKQFHATASAVLSLCGEFGLAATWGISETFTSPLLDRLVAKPRVHPPHEAAVRLNGLWTSPGSRRKLLADALARQTRQAELRGLRIRTVFADEPLLSGNHDLLVKRGITSVREIASSGKRWGRGGHTPRPLRYGLWGYGHFHNLPDDRALIIRRMTAGCPRGSRPASADSPRVLHLSIDASRLTSGNRFAWRSVDRSFRLLARLRDREGLQIEPLCAATARLAAVPAAAPQHSILRRAA